MKNLRKNVWIMHDDMKVLGLHSEWAVSRDVWKDFI